MVALTGIAKGAFRAAGALVLLLCIASMLSCGNSERKRPIGYVRMGKVQDLQADQTVLREQALLIRKDARGFSVMSLLSPVDLSQLEFKESDETHRGPLLAAANGSQYTLAGDVISGPGKTPLPYYEIQLDRGQYDGPFDTLYAKIGSEKPRDYRFVAPPAR